jgi:signal transduction histidine kinase/sensor domain CHASE-containing protein
MKFFNNLSLLKKTICLIFILGLITCVVFYVFYPKILLKSYLNIENANAQKDVGRGYKAVEAFLKQLDSKAGDWANWDDSYAFIQDNNTTFIKVNVIDNTFEQIGINLIAFINKKGEILLMRSHDYENQKEIIVDDALRENILANTSLIFHYDVQDKTNGIVLLPKGPMLIVSRPILTSNGDGPIQGSIIFGKYIDKSFVNELEKTTNLKLSFLPLSGSVGSDLAGIRDKLVKTKSYFTDTPSESKIIGYALFNDVNGDPALILKVDMSREIFQQGKKNTVGFIELVIAVILVCAVLITFSIQKLILSRMSFLEKKTVEIGKSGDISRRIDFSGKDEIASLTKEINSMLDNIERFQSSLEKEKESVEEKVVERTRELKEEQVKLKATINGLNVGFLMVNPFLKIILINYAAKRIFCSPVKEKNGEITTINSENISLFDNCDMDFIVDRLGQSFKIKEEIQKSLNQAKPLTLRNVNILDNYYNIYLNPVIVIENSKVRTIGCSAVIEDTTVQMMLQQSKDEFFSIASHELRTPLTAIRGNTSMLLDYFGDQLKDPQIREMIGDIRESSVRLIDIVNDFLNVSRLELGKMEFKKEKIEIEPLTDEVLKEYVATGFMKQLSLEAQKPESKMPLIMGDGNRIKQVIINLIGNGIKFTENGGITIKFKKEDGFVKVLVSDTGMGIGPEDQKLLFQKFQQTANNTFARDVTKGSGLGLYISRMIVEKMGGQIKLEESTLGKGTTFSFTLPTAG